MHRLAMKHRSILVYLSVALGLAMPNISAADTPNFVIVIVDDMRFDDFGAGGHSFVETPAIDRIAAEGAMFSKPADRPLRTSPRHRRQYEQGTTEPSANHVSPAPARRGL
jgi:hypothetical protein